MVCNEASRFMSNRIRNEQMKMANRDIGKAGPRVITGKIIGRVVELSARCSPIWRIGMSYEWRFRKTQRVLVICTLRRNVESSGTILILSRVHRRYRTWDETTFFVINPQNDSLLATQYGEMTIGDNWVQSTIVCVYVCVYVVTWLDIYPIDNILYRYNKH